ncbi:MAG: ASPIC/UnbV domain-containing protein [Planctomycetota bacterium]
MRDDATKSDTFKDNDAWRRQKYQNEVLVKSPKDAAGNFLAGRAFTTNSLSGNERNRTFLWSNDNFSDVSTISGADDLADGRSFALLDYDNDGWQDIALMSLNVPRFKLYRNQMKRLFPQRQSLKIKLVGGNQASEIGSEWSNGDGIGAKVLVTFNDETKILLHRQSGEGFASQNSSTLHVGLDEGKSVRSLNVQWPSGKTSVLNEPSGPIVVVKERD